MNLEKNIQKRFVDIVTNRVDVTHSSSAHRIYANLIFYRLKEILEKSLPRFTKLIDSDTFDALLYEFIKNGARSPLLWEVIAEFKEFILQNNSLEIPFLKDLLEFESLEIYTYMQNYSQQIQKKFSLKKSYQFSKLSQLITLEYPVHHPEFDTNPTNFTKGAFFVLTYYKKDTNEIIYEEITPFTKEFLSLLSPKRSLEDVLTIMAEQYEIKIEELLEVFLESLKHYVYNKVLV